MSINSKDRTVRNVFQRAIAFEEAETPLTVVRPGHISGARLTIKVCPAAAIYGSHIQGTAVKNRWGDPSDVCAIRRRKDVGEISGAFGCAYEFGKTL